VGCRCPGPWPASPEACEEPFPRPFRRHPRRKGTRRRHDGSIPSPKGIHTPPRKGMTPSSPAPLQCRGGRKHPSGTTHQALRRTREAVQLQRVFPRRAVQIECLKDPASKTAPDRSRTTLARCFSSSPKRQGASRPLWRRHTAAGPVRPPGISLPVPLSLPNRAAAAVRSCYTPRS